MRKAVAVVPAAGSGTRLGGRQPKQYLVLGGAPLLVHTLRALARGTNEVTLTFKGRLLVLVSRFFPWLVDRVTKKKVRDLFVEERAQRKNRTDKRETMSAS